MIIYKSNMGDIVTKYNNSIVLELTGNRNVLSTSIFNGGYSENIKYVFNKQEDMSSDINLKADTYEEHLGIIAKELNLISEKSTGLSTAASMDHVAIETQYYHDIEITAFITAGTEVNAGRVGDKVTFDELVNKIEYKSGTINIILNINANIPPGIMARILMTCTEAKTAALQEMMIDSRYSNGLATGTGTDGVVIIGNNDSKNYLTTAGKHSVFGEKIGKVVKKAVKDALDMKCGSVKLVQRNIIRRGRRFGITEDYLFAEYNNLNNSITKMEFQNLLYQIHEDPNLLAMSTSYFHIMDELNYDLITEKSAYFAA
ncbi:MAG: adenosylcobinamide amidohydrolase, partial [Bacillota bacterium]|nr:adenosylcobinamide amidohydrolase [Bacillota bacterium]